MCTQGEETAEGGVHSTICHIVLICSKNITCSSTTTCIYSLYGVWSDELAPKVACKNNVASNCYN